MATRTDVTFPSADAHCAAWLYPAEGEPTGAAIVLAHGFGGTREARLWAYAERFAQAGLTALVFDYRHFGGSDGEPRQLLGLARAPVARTWWASGEHPEGEPAGGSGAEGPTMATAYEKAQ